jgi:hypothetical protein
MRWRRCRADEFAAPYRELTGAGHEVVVVTPNGVVPHVDVMCLRPSMAGSEKIALGWPTPMTKRMRSG